MIDGLKKVSRRVVLFCFLQSKNGDIDAILVSVSGFSTYSFDQQKVESTECSVYQIHNAYVCIDDEKVAVAMFVPCRKSGVHHSFFSDINKELLLYRLKGFFQVILGNSTPATAMLEVEKECFQGDDKEFLRKQFLYPKTEDQLSIFKDHFDTYMAHMSKVVKGNEIYVSGKLSFPVEKDDADSDDDELVMPRTTFERSELITSFTGFCLNTVLYDEQIFTDDCKRLPNKLRSLRRTTYGDVNNAFEKANNLDHNDKLIRCKKLVQKVVEGYAEKARGIYRCAEDNLLSFLSQDNSSQLLRSCNNVSMFSVFIDKRDGVDMMDNLVPPCRVCQTHFTNDLSLAAFQDPGNTDKIVQMQLDDDFGCVINGELYEKALQEVVNAKKRKVKGGKKK